MRKSRGSWAHYPTDAKPPNKRLIAEDCVVGDEVVYDEPPTCVEGERRFPAPSTRAVVSMFIRTRPLLRFILDNGRQTEPIPVEYNQRLHVTRAR